MLEPAPAFLNVLADVGHAPPPREDDRAVLANTYVKAARAAERAERWLLAQLYYDRAKRLLEI